MIMFFDMLGLLLVFALVLLLAYYTTRFIGKRFTGRTKNKTMRVIETLPLGLEKSLYLILVGKKYFLFHSSKKGLELVSEIELDEQPEAAQESNETANVFDFRRIFETYSGLSQRDKQNQDAHNDGESNEPKAAGILGSIKRLKKLNMNKE